jgi:hypothetical protein
MLLALWFSRFPAVAGVPYLLLFVILNYQTVVILSAIDQRSINLGPVLRIRDVYPGSWIINFPSRIQGQKDSRSWIPDPDPHQRIEVFLTQKFVSKRSEI